MRLTLPYTVWAGVLLLFAAGARPAAAQKRVDVGGTAYVDYFYNLEHPDDARDGLHGFTYRRLFLTADVQLDEAFTGRIRLEASASTTQAPGPVPFVKDLWVRWKSPGDHRLTFGVQPPPAFEVSEGVWGYRSLEKTIMDLFGYVDPRASGPYVESRDFGLRADGPLGTSRLRYAVMAANNAGVRPETDKYKRGYAQLEARPTDHLVFTAGADYATYPAERDGAFRLSGFAGYTAAAFSAGVEAFRLAQSFAGEGEEETLGATLFARVGLAPGWEVIGRADRLRSTVDAGRVFRTFALVGVSYAPVRGVRLIPNLHLLHRDGDEDPALTGRMTVDLQF